MSKRELTAEDFAKLKQFGTLTQDEVAFWYGISQSKLEKWRHEKVGPPFIKPDKRVYYRVTDIEAWLDQHKVQTMEV